MRLYGFATGSRTFTTRSVVKANVLRVLKPKNQFSNLYQLQEVYTEHGWAEINHRLKILINPFKFAALCKQQKDPNVSFFQVQHYQNICVVNR